MDRQSIQIAGEADQAATLLKIFDNSPSVREVGIYHADHKIGYGRERSGSIDAPDSTVDGSGGGCSRETGGGRLEMRLTERERRLLMLLHSRWC